MNQITQQVQKITSKLENEKELITTENPIIKNARQIFERQWQEVEYNKKEYFQKLIEKNRTLLQLERGIIESTRGFIDDKVLQELQTGFEKIRFSNNLLQLNGVHHKYRDDVKLRQVCKLIFAVYRYNRDILFDDTDTNLSTLKSRIKHASLCPHCGEVAKQILMNMMETKMVLLPD